MMPNEMHREEHCNEGDKIRHRRHAVRSVRYPAIDTEGRDRHHEDKTVDDHIEDGKRALETVIIIRVVLILR